MVAAAEEMFTTAAALDARSAGRSALVRRIAAKLIVDRSRHLLEQVLEDQRRPGLVARLHQRATLFDFPEIHRREAELFGECPHGRCSRVVVARQEYDPAAPLYFRVGSQGAGRQVIEALDEA